MSIPAPVPHLALSAVSQNTKPPISDIRGKDNEEDKHNTNYRITPDHNKPYGLDHLKVCVHNGIEAASGHLPTVLVPRAFSIFCDRGALVLRVSGPLISWSDVDDILSAVQDWLEVQAQGFAIQFEAISPPGKVVRGSLEPRQPRVKITENDVLMAREEAAVENIELQGFYGTLSPNLQIIPDRRQTYGLDHLKSCVRDGTTEASRHLPSAQVPMSNFVRMCDRGALVLRVHSAAIILWEDVDDILSAVTDWLDKQDSEYSFIFVGTKRSGAILSGRLGPPLPATAEGKVEEEQVQKWAVAKKMKS